MKSRFAILLLVLLCGGCTEKHRAPTLIPISQIQAGKEARFGEYLVYVAKREGDLLKGVRVESKGRDGKITTITSETGSMSVIPGQSSINLVLHNAQIEMDGQKALSTEMVISLPVF